MQLTCSLLSHISVLIGRGVIDGVSPISLTREKMEEGIISPKYHKSNKGIGLGFGLELYDLWDDLYVTP